jgi:hypothetical protein
MKITYRNGIVLEAVTLQSSSQTMRVAVNGHDDVMEFNRIHGVWVSEDCEPVIVATTINCQRIDPVFSEDDFICSPALASHLISLLTTGDDVQFLDYPPPADSDRLRDSPMVA